MRVGIFGGSFNPPHKGHLLLARAAYEGGKLEKVILIPCGNPPHKDKRDFADAGMRLEMTRLLVDGDKRFEVSDTEIKHEGKSYTAHTLERLKNRHPDWRLCFIAGEDSLRDMETWYMPERIFEIAEILAAVRGGMEHSELSDIAEHYRRKYGAIISFIPMSEIEISASEIRRRLKNGENTAHMLTDKVAKYIEEKGIYRENRSGENRHQCNRKGT